jgi:5S rRNA maturation endonuclease (ribonuclease M5)
MTSIEVWNKVYCPDSGEDIFEYIERAMTEYARIKCLEAIKNTRHKAEDIIDIESYYSENGTLQVNTREVIRQIQNIPNQDVMPEL